MINSPENYGKPISEELSTYLKEYTDNNDRANVAAKSRVGISTIRDVTYRNNNLTETNAEAITELMKIAIINCQNRIQYSKKVKKDLESQLTAV